MIKNTHVLMAGAVVAGLAAMIGGFGGMYTIDEGERGVVLHFGEISRVTDPGLNFKVPMIDRVVKIQTRTNTGQLSNVLAYSSDQQPADITMSVTFAISNDGVADLYTQFGNVDNVYERIIVPVVKKQTKTVFGQYTAFRSVQSRDQLNIDTFNAIETALSSYPYIQLKSVQIENIDFSDAYEQTIEDRMKAEVEVERFRQNLEREKIEAQIAVTKAQGVADARVKQAEAEAKAITLKADAEAGAIEIKGKALRDNPTVINLIQTEKWNGTLPTTMLPNGTVPMINLENVKGE